MDAAKAGDVCGFCKRGPEVEDVCGKLHVDLTTDNKVVAGHHKCMQYSALLTQYKFESFGGFKIEKVQAELQRGKKMKCSLCGKKKSKSGSGEPASKMGATSGCAIKRCHKTFHYYCAVGNENVITKRLVVNFKHKAKKAVLYRVFCSEQHKLQYLTELKTEKERDLLLNVGDESDVSDEDEDGEIPDRSRPRGEGSSSQRDDLYADQETSFIQLGTPQLIMSPQSNCEVICFKSSSDFGQVEQPSMRTVKHMVYPLVTVDRPDQVLANGVDDVGSLSDDAKIALIRHRKTSSSDHAYVKSPERDERKSSLDNTGSKSKPSPPKNVRGRLTLIKYKEHNKDKNVKSPLLSLSPQTPVKFNVPQELSPFVRLSTSIEGNPQKIPSSNSKSTSTATVIYAKVHSAVKDGAPPQEPKTASQAACSVVPPNTVALCILGTEGCSEERYRKLMEVVCSRYDIPPGSVYVWQRIIKRHGLAQSHMSHYMSDLAKKLQQGKLEDLLQALVLPKATGLLEKYENIVEFQEKLELSIRSQLEEGILKETAKIMKKISRSLGTKAGGLFRMDNTFVLVLLLNDFTDQANDLRAIFPGSVDSAGSTPRDYGTLYPWHLDDCDCVVTMKEDKSSGKLYTDTAFVSQLREEVSCIKRWLITQLSGVSHAIIRPKEREILAEPNSNRTSVAVNVGDFLVKTFQPMSASADSRVLCLSRVDQSILNHREYFHRVLVQFVSKPRTSSVLLCVMDMGDFDTKTLKEDIRRTEQVAGCMLDVFTTADPATNPRILSVIIRVIKTPRPIVQTLTEPKTTTREKSPQISAPQKTSPGRSIPQRTTSPHKSTPQKSLFEEDMPQRMTPEKTLLLRSTPQKIQPRITTPQKSSPQRTTPPRAVSQRPKVNDRTTPPLMVDALRAGRPNRKSHGPPSESEDSLGDFAHTYTPRIIIPGSAKRKYVEDNEKPSTSKVPRRRLVDRSPTKRKSDLERRRSERIKLSDETAPSL